MTRSIEDQAHEVIEALWRRPELLHAVLGELGKRSWVLGPWQSQGRNRGKRRRDALGRGTAVVFPMGKAEPGEPHHWFIREGVGAGKDVARGTVPTEAIATQTAEDWLRANGHVLIEGGLEPVTPLKIAFDHLTERVDYYPPLDEEGSG